MTSTIPQFYTNAVVDEDDDDASAIVRQSAEDDVTIQPIQDPTTALPAIPPAKPDKSAVPVCPFVNTALNSRLSPTLTERGWKPAYTCALDPKTPARHVLHAAGRTVVQCDLQWLMFDDAGQPVAHGALGASHVLLDPAAGRLITVEFDGALEAFALADGVKQFSLHLSYGSGFARPLLAMDGNRLTTIGIEQPTEGQDLRPPNLSLVEVLDLGDPIKIEDGNVTSLDGVGELMRDSDVLQGAFAGEALTLVSTDRIYQVSRTLSILRIFGADFEPEIFSLDEAGRVYLVAGHAGKRRLWLIEPDGRRRYDVELPPGLEGLIAPPIVGYDHRAYLMSSARVVAIQADGTVAWMRPAAKRFGGATVTADDKLLASDGGDVVAFGPSGERVAIVNVKEESGLSTPPILTQSGRLMVASPTHLYCFATK